MVNSKCNYYSNHFSFSQIQNIIVVLHLEFLCSNLLSPNITYIKTITKIHQAHNEDNKTDEQIN